MIFHWLTRDEDNSISIEMIDVFEAKEQLRIGIHFEHDLSESSWTFVTKDRMECGILPKEFIDALRKHLEERK